MDGQRFSSVELIGRSSGLRPARRLVLPVRRLGLVTVLSSPSAANAPRTAAATSRYRKQCSAGGFVSGATGRDCQA